mgnify:CR=1 FL=1
MIAILIKDGPPPNPRVFERSEVSIGRADENEIALSCVDVSRRHCKVLATGTEFHLLDLQSRNGTFVNGKRIHQLARIAPGDEVAIGTVRFYLHDEMIATNQASCFAPGCQGDASMHRRGSGRGPDDPTAPATIRLLIEQTLPFEPDFDAFCIDHFPDAKRQFGSDMCRTSKINFLLLYVDRAYLYALLINRLNRKP